MFKNTLPERPSADQVRSALLAAGEQIHGLQSKSEDDRGETHNADLRSAVDFINTYDSVLTSMERGAQADPAATEPMSNPGHKTLGQLAVESDGYGDIASRSGDSNSRSVSVDVRGSAFSHNHQYRIDSGDNITGGAGALLPAGQPIGPVPRQQRLFVRDVLSVVQTNLSSVPYVREYTPVSTELDATTVAEGAAKPEVAMLWEGDDAPVRKIAGWVPVTTEIIEDAPTLAGYIDARLAYMLAVREEQQVLNGTGTGSELKGILTYAGVQAQAYSSDIASTLGLAISKIEAVDGDPDGVALHPTDFWTMLTTRNASQFDGGFGTGAPGAVPFQTVWGVPVIRSRAITVGEGIVGSFRMGATMFDRMETTLRIGNQHSDFFTTNKVAVLAEERVALAVHRPDFFVKADLTEL